MLYLPLIYFVKPPLHVSVSCQLTYNTYQMLYIYSVYLLMMGNKHA
jgi:hypothetical protein